MVERLFLPTTLQGLVHSNLFFLMVMESFIQVDLGGKFMSISASKAAFMLSHVNSICHFCLMSLLACMLQIVAFLWSLHELYQQYEMQVIWRLFQSCLTLGFDYYVYVYIRLVRMFWVELHDYIYKVCFSHCVLCFMFSSVLFLVRVNKYHQKENDVCWFHTASWVENRWFERRCDNNS